MAIRKVTLGLQARLMLGIAGLATTLVAGVGWAWTQQVERSLSEALQQRANRMAHLVQSNLAGPIWKVDQGSIDSLLDAAMTDPEVAIIELHSDLSAGAPLMRQRTRPPVNPLRLVYDVPAPTALRPEGGMLGTVALTFSRELVQQQVGELHRFVLTLMLGVLAAVMLSSYFLVRRFVKQPVRRLGELAQRVAAGDLGAQMPVAYPDEIGQLTAQFNHMSAQLLASSHGLKLSEERYRSLYENAPEGIFQADGRGRLLDLNVALARMLGFSHPAQALAAYRRLRQLVTLEARDYRRLRRALVRDGRLQQVQLLMATPGLGPAPDHAPTRITHAGREIWVELSAYTVASADGSQVRVEGMVSNITQRRRAELALMHHRDHLEDVVAERTQALRQAITRAEESGQAKSRFLATMSHEFRTPLNAILGFAQLLQMDDLLRTDQRARVDSIRNSGEHLLYLISDMLDMASIEAGKVRLNPSAVDLRALLEMVADSIRLRAQEKGLRFDVVLAPQLPQRLMVDGQRLRQVLLNLLSNAVKFTDHGGVHLEVSVVAQGEAMTQLRFSVRDSGIGIAPEDAAQLFQPFAQVADAARCLGGTGLGLSISQQLVHQMDSEIRLISTPAMGSEFVFELALPNVPR
ncbi:ATP-binding protein [Roseateles koreensis]|uniref:histidine kinase n=1 Tax=Roseateles koreensis TaxID=2987526 RepID=A0ABT5KWQ6_9BURK|nr:ATP-binding protein [Roseateles koreensis]MDC8787231.1 ATP-binding protein [Roseateles koreensis]